MDDVPKPEMAGYAIAQQGFSMLNWNLIRAEFGLIFRNQINYAERTYGIIFESSVANYVIGRIHCGTETEVAHNDFMKGYFYNFDSQMIAHDLHVYEQHMVQREYYRRLAVLKTPDPREGTLYYANPDAELLLEKLVKLSTDLIDFGYEAVHMRTDDPLLYYARLRNRRVHDRKSKALG